MNGTAKFYFTAIFALIVLGALLNVGASAQTRRRAKTKSTPVVYPTPIPSGAEIISRADDPRLVPIEEPTPYDDATNGSQQTIDDLKARIKTMEAARPVNYDEQQKRLLMNLDILTKAEQRSEGLRKQIFDLIEKENAVRSRIDQIDVESSPEMISRSATFSGSMKPEAIREARKRSLDSEKANLQSLLADIETARVNLTASSQRADVMVEKVRFRLEKEIDDALVGADDLN